MDSVERFDDTEKKGKDAAQKTCEKFFRQPLNISKGGKNGR